ncbi:phosphotransferase [Shinella sp.]|uniref:phosphotransferase n=1 Tax=Shinella sp. TaxID=1870904 RepID=UPI0025894372|nr:phosphotransferase [Shinella sp.]MCW5706875.1 phosphotransferase [Shinella sp.]
MSTLQKTGFVLDPGIIEFLTDTGLAEEGAFEAAPLTGGVASDIWKIRTLDRVFVVKKALARLRVAQEWNAPVSRNASEVEWLIEAGKVAPAAVPEILAHDPDRGVFAMSYLEPADHPVWKAELQRGNAEPAFAAKLGRVLAAIHAATAGSEDLAWRFANDDVFHPIRLEPYIEAAARVHADLSQQLLALSRRTLDTKKALVHGDVSPKNILVGPHGPIILDAECAWYGDPAFDIAFCLNHLLLKCLWTPTSRADYARCFDALAESYLGGVDWEEKSELERRAASLLPALSLARVDGKSPVEYLTEDADKEFVRSNSRLLIKRQPETLADIKEHWIAELSKND